MDCYGGLDLSSTTDLTALVLAFPWGDEIVFECRFFVPEESIRQRSHRDRVPYDQWAKEGWIIPTPGGSVDYDFVRKELGEIRTKHNLVTLAMDPWNATQLAQQLTEDGIEVVEFRQGYASMSSPAKSFETHVIAGDFNHQGNPVLAWCVSNTVIDTDPAGNIKPTKAKSTERIDGTVAAIMSVGVLEQGDTGSSVYRTEGVFYL
jgi:phage terminase large subunit-like protein